MLQEPVQGMRSVECRQIQAASKRIMKIKYFQQLGQFKNINDILEPDWQDENDTDESDADDNTEDTDGGQKITTIDDLVGNAEVDPDSDQPDPDDFCDDCCGK